MNILYEILSLQKHKQNMNLGFKLQKKYRLSYTVFDMPYSHSKHLTTWDPKTEISQSTFGCRRGEARSGAVG